MYAGVQSNCALGINVSLTCPLVARTLTPYSEAKEKKIMLGTIFLIVLILALVGALPVWPHARSWGYYPSGGVGLVLLLVIVLFLVGRL
jgi:hypothetical protein